MSAPARKVDEPGFRLEPFSYAEARRLAAELELAEPVAVTLVRRGYRTVEAARAFLDAADSHDPFELGDMAAAVAAIRAAIERGERVTVHGDYDADGVSATSILVGALRDSGAECDWFIPDRMADGYGLSAATVELLAARGTRLLITVDCGIGSAGEVDLAKSLGMGVVVTDHHQPGERLPDCPILHPELGGYPCPDLCAAGVAHKLAVALAGPERADLDLDLVALATVADMVPLRGENRALVRRGLAEARRARRPGLRALMAAAGVAPERLDEGDIAFRLAPRINAAGRLYRADAGVELMLTDDDERAVQIAADLNRANGERRETEAAVLADAERQLAALPAADAIVLWGEGWHPGVVGICASRMVERHNRPAILIGLDGEGSGKGSGRSVPGFDLLAGLEACESRLRRFGGHRAAAGLEIEAGELDAFRIEFCAYVAAELDPSALARPELMDAVVGGESLGYEVAGQLARLGPFGKGNPGIRLLVPAARVRDVRPMGEGDRHARFSLASGSARAAGVAFGVNGELAAAAEAGPLDVSVELELNEWNGAVEARVVLGEVYGADEPDGADGAGDPRPDTDEFITRLEAELGRPPASAPAAPSSEGRRTTVERGRGSGVATVAALASTGEPVLVVAADALWRRALVERAARPARFGGGEVALLAVRGSLAAGALAAERVLAFGNGVVLADWPALSLVPSLARRFDHVVVVDPAPAPELDALACEGLDGGGGFLHRLAEASDPSLALRALEAEHPGRTQLSAMFRALREVASYGPRPAAALWAEALAIPGSEPRSPESVARCLRVLEEVGAVRWTGSGSDRTLQAVSSVQRELELCPSFVAYRDAHEECTRFLNEGGKSS